MFMRFLRVFRLARVLRVFRAVRFLQQLRLMLDCIMGCFEALMWCLLLIIFFLFLFSVILVQGMTSYVRDIDSTRDLNSVRDIERRFGGIIPTLVSLFQATTNGV